MKMTKKLISLALAAMLLLCLAVPAMADDSDFIISSNYLAIYKGPGGDIVIPEGVTYIGYLGAPICDSTNRDKVTGVTIPEGVIWIQGCAFQGCTNLVRVSIPSSVTKIQFGAFQDCTSLKSITIPASVTTLENDTFLGCTSLTDVYFEGTQEQWAAIEQKNISLGLTRPIFDEGSNPTIHYNGAESGAPAQTEPAQSGNAMPTNDQLTVNGALQAPTVYKIGGSNFFKIRDLAAMLNGTEKQFDVGYDGALRSVTLTTGKGYAQQPGDMGGAAADSAAAEPSNDSIYVDGQKIDVTVYKIGGCNFFMLRDIGRALGFYVGWTREDGVFIDTSKPYSD
ncbi:MAG: leucine-rich repeat protein [Butyricicoccus sp.]|nr:leucine-rich repeat protein [Butyricicoccus sp.]